MCGPSISTIDCQSERCFTHRGLERSAISQRNSSIGFWKSIGQKLKIFEIFTRHSRSKYPMARTQAKTPPSPTSNHLFVEALLKLAATSDEFQELVQAMANKTASPEQLASLTEYVSLTAKDVTDDPAPLEESQGTLKKQHVKELLDPNLSLTADSVRDFFLPRNN